MDNTFFSIYCVIFLQFPCDCQYRLARNQAILRHFYNFPATLNADLGNTRLQSLSDHTLVNVTLNGKHTHCLINKYFSYILRHFFFSIFLQLSIQTLTRLHSLSVHALGNVTLTSKHTLPHQQVLIFYTLRHFSTISLQLSIQTLEVLGYTRYLIMHW